MSSRREFLRSAPLAAGMLIIVRPPGLGRSINHPDPRPGIDASGVLTADQLQGFPDNVRAIYDMIREIPHVADGIGCACGCSALPTYRSLLTCYHSEGMAMGCAICQGEAMLVYRRHEEGQTLEQIRRAINARFG